mmetsp:Transcript_35868/g.89509  ORF Transcript_35868/g.89509 Transcript_35868/m.89509 type:complete len:202 (-) Transcript_35868:168-773(-)
MSSPPMRRDTRVALGLSTSVFATRSTDATPPRTAPATGGSFTPSSKPSGGGLQSYGDAGFWSAPTTRPASASSRVAPASRPSCASFTSSSPRSATSTPSTSPRGTSPAKGTPSATRLAAGESGTTLRTGSSRPKSSPAGTRPSATMWTPAATPRASTPTCRDSGPRPTTLSRTPGLASMFGATRPTTLWSATWSTRCRRTQ